MPERVVLTLTRLERDAIADELRKYACFREDVGSALMIARVSAEPDYPDPPGITRDAERMIASHHYVAQGCEELAVSFESDEPTLLTLGAIGLIEDALDNAYIEELPPELGRTAMLCRLARRQMAGFGGRDPKAVGEFVAVNAETQPAARSGVAPDVVAPDAVEASPAEKDPLAAQVAQLVARVDSLTAQLGAHHTQIDRLRKQAAQRLRRGRNPITTTYETPPQRPYRSGPGIGL